MLALMMLHMPRLCVGVCCQSDDGVAQHHRQTPLILVTQVHVCRVEAVSNTVHRMTCAAGSHTSVHEQSGLASCECTL